MDHRLLHHFSLELINDNPNRPFLFYEDLPYADYIVSSKNEKLISNIKGTIDIKPYIFRNFKIEDKINLLKIYKSQMNKDNLEMVRHYWNSLGNGERIWLTTSANKYLHKKVIKMS